MADKYNVVISCGARKAFDVELSYTGQTPKEWLKEAKQCTQYIAGDLYAGAPFEMVRRAKENMPNVQFWILSAGFGYIKWEDMIPSYDATFSGGKLKESKVKVSKEQWFDKISLRKAPKKAIYIIPQTYMKFTDLKDKDFLVELDHTHRLCSEFGWSRIHWARYFVELVSKQQPKTRKAFIKASKELMEISQRGDI